MSGVVGKVKDKVGEGVFSMLEKVLGDIDAFDQIAELVKSVVPLKAEITVKGKKAVEVQAMVKNGVLWVGFKKAKEKPAEKLETNEPEEITEARMESEET